MKESGMAATKTFWTSFLDGLTGAGIFGDLRIPGTPTRLFKEDSEELLRIDPQRVGEIARSLTEHSVYIAGLGNRVPARFFGGGMPSGDVAVEGVNVDVNGEVVNIKRDREKGWVVVSEPTTRAAG